MNYATRIRTIDQAKDFIAELNASGKMFHFEDSPESIISGSTGEALFSLSDCKKIRARVRELYSFRWGEFDCPIGYALYVMGHVIE